MCKYKYIASTGQWCTNGSCLLLQAYCEKGLGGVIVNLLGSNYTCDSPEREVRSQISNIFCIEH